MYGSIFIQICAVGSKRRIFSAPDSTRVRSDRSRQRWTFNKSISKGKTWHCKSIVKEFVNRNWSHCWLNHFWTLNMITKSDRSILPNNIVNISAFTTVRTSLISPDEYVSSIAICIHNDLRLQQAQFSHKHTKILMKKQTDLYIRDTL